MKKVALLTIHGMGRTKSNYHKGLETRLQTFLGRRWEEVYVSSVFYQDILQENEDRVWEQVKLRLRCNPWNRLREFLLFGFADAAGLEAEKGRPNSVYTEAQVRIARAFFDARTALEGDGPVVVLAHSLGGQVLSNYLWDAQKYRERKKPASFGIWRKPQKFAQVIGQKNALTDAEWSFVAGGTLFRLFTTGCNIPIFVAAWKCVVPIDKPNEAFAWHNFYDKDDVLGWPLGPLSEEYAKRVRDFEIGVSRSFVGRVVRSWNPLVHWDYWHDEYVLSGIANELETAINASAGDL